MIPIKGKPKKFGAFISLSQPCATQDGKPFDSLDRDTFKSEKQAWEWVRTMIGDSKEDDVLVYCIIGDYLVPLSTNK